jgi:conjugative relaxase-like TrwC/TraI family protein
MHFKCVGKVQVTAVPVGSAGIEVIKLRIITVMMSLRAVHAGSGYRYLLRSVATNDAAPDAEHADRLSEYYAAKGTPPGRWRGSGLAALSSDHLTNGEVISADQMGALYGEGLHPDADQMMADGVDLKDCKLGRSYSVFTGGSSVLSDLATREKAFRSEHGRRPEEDERSQLAQQAGFAHYADAHDGIQPTGAREVLAWVNAEQDRVRQAVAGYDLTFSPVKSVSVLWALADKDVSKIIAQAHHEAAAEALGWVEDNALFTRLGVNGIQQVKTNGVIASEFTHFDTRGGDPDLHSHILVSNKVQVADTPEARALGKVGEWKTIDGSQFFEHMQAASGVYNSALQQRLTEALGVEFTPVSHGNDAEPVWEIKGVPRTLNDRFSSRRALAKPIFDRLVADYVDKHGKQPSQRVNYSLWQAAILETRDAKKPAESLDALREQWRSSASEVLSDHEFDHLVDAVRTAEHTRPEYRPGDADKIATAAIDRVLTRRATFKKSHIHTAVSQQLRGVRFTDNDQRQRAYEQVMDTAMNSLSVCLTPPESLDLPEALTTDDGRGIDRRNNAEIYSTAEHLAAEQSILDAADTIAPVFVNDAAISDALEDFTASNGFSLNDGQEAMARYLLNAGSQVAVAVGPAGTGKTTSMELVTKVWKDAGHSVIGLAPSAAAAKILGDDIGAEAHTIDRLTFAWNNAKGEGKSPTECMESLPVLIARGDMLLVDEAGMASTDRLATLVEIANESGAVIRMVGDPAQLDAVETGGVFRNLSKRPGTPMLTDVMRMGDDTAQAAATLKLRDGNTDGLGLYTDRGWVTGGARDAMLTAAVDGYLTDTADGRRSMVIAPTNADVKAMNEMIQAVRVDRGDVSTEGRTAALSDGLTAHVGDTVLARKNMVLGSIPGKKNSGTRVLNGQILTVRTIARDGSLHCFDPQSKTRVHLPADYVSQSTQLGYASTVHRAQGATVDTTHSLVDASVDRNGLYVAVTRGKASNKLYVDTATRVDETAEDAHVHHSGDTSAPTTDQILHGIVHHDDSQLAAVDEITNQLDEATSNDRITGLYREGVARATDAFTREVSTRLIDSLPAAHAAAIDGDPDGREAVDHAITYAATHGVDPRELWLTASEDIDWATSPGRLIASRMRTDVDQITDEGAGSTLPTPPPALPTSDHELDAWLAATYVTLTGSGIESDDEATEYIEDVPETQEHDISQGQALQDEVQGTGALSGEPEPTDAPSDDVEDSPATRYADQWVDSVMSTSTSLRDAPPTDRQELVDAALAALAAGATLDNVELSVVFAADGTFDNHGTPLQRALDAIDAERAAADGTGMPTYLNSPTNAGADVNGDNTFTLDLANEQQAQQFHGPGHDAHGLD